jgi:lysophospholipase L1-like esterase
MMTKALGLAILAAVAMLVACADGQMEGPTGPGPIPQPNSTINYTAIGASDANGVGSSMVCVPYTECPNGRGYVQVAARELQARGFTVKLTNYGFPAMVLSPRIQEIGKQAGRDIPGNMIDLQAPFVSPDTTLVTIFAGANDVDSLVAALGNGAGAADQAGYINGQIQAFGQDFVALLAKVRSLAPEARIVVLNLPNMAGMPRSARVSIQQRRAQQMLSVGINTQVINAQIANSVLVLDLMCDSRSYQASTYSSDGFHPSDTGYAWIAAEVVAAATTTYKAPASSCPQMTLVN